MTIEDLRSTQRAAILQLASKRGTRNVRVFGSVARVQAHGKGLELICDILPEVSEYVVGDSTRIRQVLVNLLGNAIKFTQHREVQLEVGLESLNGDGLRLHFSICDTGIGIPQHKQKMIFDPFSQADGSTTRKFGGTGLGLTISTRLVEAMQGKIWVESAPGTGSCFHFTTLLGASRETRQIQNLSARPQTPSPLSIP